MPKSQSASLSNEQAAALLTELAAMLDVGSSPASRLVLLEDRKLGRIAKAARQINASLQRGQALPEAVSAQLGSLGSQLSEVLRSTLSGAVPSDSLRELARFLQNRAAFQRELLYSLIYPTLVVLIGYAALVLSLSEISSHTATERLMSEVWSQRSRAVATCFLNYWYVPPLIVAVFTLFSFSIASWFGAIGRLSPGTRWGRLALFCDLLAIQLKQGSDLPEAARLTADCLHDRRLRQAADALAKHPVRQDMPPPLPAMPPLLSWVLTSMDSSEQTTQALHQLAQNYRQHQLRQWIWFTKVIPTVIVVGVGGTMALGYVLLVLRPVYQLVFTWAQA